MGGFFGAVSNRDVTLDVFFGVDYHSHLGTRRGGMILFDGSLNPYISTTAVNNYAIKMNDKYS